MRQSFVDENARVRFSRRFVAYTVRQEIASAEFIETHEPRLCIERRLLQRLGGRFVADLADGLSSGWKADSFTINFNF
ncbi:hypothetical protein CQ10_32035 [Bradyrhizobium valentinum]|uniref:Uncharacterized protein n=1 Tax=Bradyrhizobium valentinum TaxID=1518501 RepID=A0A0R3KTW2_9BRAD|nr:hypothetical protein CQ10_32035 [Bradyrhizobium valentinum]KRQ96418.1 hypothetical protein CP49_39280 [Bradyrhizobium valentinum]